MKQKRTTGMRLLMAVGLEWYAHTGRVRPACLNTVLQCAFRSGDTQTVYLQIAPRSSQLQKLPLCRNIECARML